MRSFVTLFVLCALFLWGAAPGFGAPVAQDAPVEAPVNPYVDVATAGDQITTTAVNFVFGTITSLGAGALVTTLTAISKRLSFLRQTSAATIAFAWGVLITVAATAATYLGVESQFKRGLDVIIAMLPAIMMLIGIPVASSYFHEQAAKMPGGSESYIGYKRTPPLALVEAVSAPAAAGALDETGLARWFDERFKAYLAGQADGLGWTPDNPNIHG